MNIDICCIKCNKPIETWDPVGDGYCFVDTAIRFTSHGNYGSRVLDGGPQVEIYLCDDCFVNASKDKMIVEVREIKTTTTSYHLYTNDAVNQY
ncbi:MAG TPA: hypothetical protein VLG50_05660 [Candidatus Saccharimonadales bacterium]|nr:hypothetical protein [Candidatus Saccharimonadales bacterium]